MLKKIADRLLGLGQQTPQGAPAEAGAPRAAILDQYVRIAPGPQQAADIFKGDWWSSLPTPLDGVQAGQLPLFDDPRIHWAIETFGGVAGKRVLELGPLEGGHTYSLERAGARSILAIEASTKAYLKCLVVKELLHLRSASFVLGDFEEYLRGQPERFDAVVASGVLYHMRNPVELLANLAKVSDRVFIWTQYYEKSRLDQVAHMKDRFGETQVSEHAGFRHTLHRYFYGDFLNTSRFAGGSDEYSNWLSREDLMGALRHVGLTDIVVGKEELDHANGPCLSLVARRPGG